LTSAPRYALVSPSWRTATLPATAPLCTCCSICAPTCTRPTKPPTSRSGRLIDSIALLLFHPISESKPHTIRLDELRPILRSDWGWYTTITDNLAKVTDRVAGVDLAENQKSLVVERIIELDEAIRGFPKTMKWTLRSKVGLKMPWYDLPEEVWRDECDLFASGKTRTYWLSCCAPVYFVSQLYVDNSLPERSSFGARTETWEVRRAWMSGDRSILAFFNPAARARRRLTRNEPSGRRNLTDSPLRPTTSDTTRSVGYHIVHQDITLSQICGPRATSVGAAPVECRRLRICTVADDHSLVERGAARVHRPCGRRR
jgi:hypothetical protein